jgi:hypothetical protein
LIRPASTRSTDYRHALARFHAPAADLRTLLHLGIITKLFTIDGTAFADFRTGATGKAMQRRGADHKIGARLTNFGAVHQQANVGSFGVASPFF